MTNDEKGFDVVMAAVQRRAMEIIALPQDKREAQYALYRETYLRSAKAMTAGNEKAWEELAEKMVEYTRALVKIIETSGGGDGGGKA